MEKVVMIDKVLVYPSSSDSYFKHFKVETKMKEGDKWVDCTKEYNMPKPATASTPHVAICDKPTVAKYLRVSTRGPYMAMYELKVVGEGKFPSWFIITEFLNEF